MQPLDLTGRTFGRLTAVWPAARRPGRGRWWLCWCECGHTTEQRAGDFARGHAASCGCLKAEAAADRGRRLGLGRRGRMSNNYRPDPPPRAVAAVLLRDRGLTYQAIADVIGVSRPHAREIVARWGQRVRSRSHMPPAPTVGAG